MRLYSRMGATAVADGREHYEAAADGAFDFPEEVATRLHGFAVDGQPMWETITERQQRIMTEEMERRKDPATLLDAVQQIVKAAQAVTTPAASQEAPAPLAPPPPPVPAAVPQPAQAESGGPATALPSPLAFPTPPPGGNP